MSGRQPAPLLSRPAAMALVALLSIVGVTAAPDPDHQRHAPVDHPIFRAGQPIHMADKERADVGGWADRHPPSVGDTAYMNCTRAGPPRSLERELEFVGGVKGEKLNGELPHWITYAQLQMLLAFLMGIGKGGTPGASTSSVALNSLFAADGCIDLAVSLAVPIGFLADATVTFNYMPFADWSVIKRLVPPTLVGIMMGTTLTGKLSSAHARGMVGGVLLGILLLNLVLELHQVIFAAQKPHSPPSPSPSSSSDTSPLTPALGADSRATNRAVARPASRYRRASKGGRYPAEPSALPTEAEPSALPTEAPPAFASTLWFAWLIGVVGGFATILTNSMGPMLNVFLLTLRLDPKVFVGTRGSFFMVVNSCKMLQRMYSQTLSLEMLWISCQLGVFAITGVFAARAIVNRISKTLFRRIEYVLMTYASLRLLSSVF